MKLNLIGLSSGKDSTALLGWAIHESGYPRESIVCVFTDTENEYDEVYQQIKDLNAYCLLYGVSPIVYLRASGEWVEKFWMFPLFLALVIWKGFFPSATKRFCTQYLKIDPLTKFIQELRVKGHEVITHSGVRASESIERSVLEEWGMDMFGCKVRRPLLKWTLSNVWDAHKRFGLPVNKLYKLGWKRVGCRLCIMSKKHDVRLTTRKRPWVIKLYWTWELIASAYASSNGSVGSFKSWFHKNTVPERFRSLPVKTKKKGVLNFATINDVSRWSMTQKGAKFPMTKEMLEEEDFNLDDSHAPCQSGLCE